MEPMTLQQYLYTISPCNVRIIEAISPCNVRIIEAISPYNVRIIEAISPCNVRIIEAISPCNVRIIEGRFKNPITRCMLRLMQNPVARLRLIIKWYHRR